MTLDAWVNPTSLNFQSGYAAIVAKSGSAARNYGLFLTSAGAVHLSYINASGVNVYITTSSGLVSAGSWTNVAGVIDASGMMQIFVNGQMVDSQATSGPMVTDTAPLTIGASDGGANLFTGLIDEVQVYNRALTTADVQSLFADTAITSAASASSPLPGLTHSYSGQGNATDSVSGNNGATQGNVSYASGKVGEAFSFSGSGYVSVPSAASLGFTAAVTLDAWVNPATLNFPGGYGAIVAKSGSGARNYGLFVTSAGAVHLSYVNATGVNTYITTNPGLVSAGTWTNVAGVIDTVDNVMQVYVNGTLVASQATNGPMVTDTAPLTIGASDGGGNLFQGLIDEVQIYNIALPPTGIGALLGGPGIGPNTDQRGSARVAGAQVDIGATEYQSDLSISGSATVGAANNMINYQFTLTNNGPDPIAGATLTDVLPSTVTFRSLTAPAGWTLSQPAVGASGTIMATDTASLAAGASATFTVVVQANSSTRRKSSPTRPRQAPRPSTRIPAITA